jgi:hypothetical protein
MAYDVVDGLRLQSILGRARWNIRREHMTYFAQWCNLLEAKRTHLLKFYSPSMLTDVMYPHGLLKPVLNDPCEIATGMTGTRTYLVWGTEPSTYHVSIYLPGLRRSAISLFIITPSCLWQTICLCLYTLYIRALYPSSSSRLPSFDRCPLLY